MNDAEIAQLKGAVNAGRIVMYRRQWTDGSDLKRITGFSKNEKTGDEYAVFDPSRPWQGAHLGNNGAHAFFELTRLFPNAS